MYAFAKIFPADVRKRVARADWQDGGRFYAAHRHDRMCPIGMAMIALNISNNDPDVIVKTPSPGHFLTLWARNADKFEGGTQAYTDYLTYRSIQHSSRRFMNLFDGGFMTNERVARAFGYPELACAIRDRV